MSSRKPQSSGNQRTRARSPAPRKASAELDRTEQPSQGKQMESSALNGRRQRFVDEYMLDQNATQAAVRAGYSERSAKVTGSRLLTDANVVAAIAARRAALAEKARITQERVLDEYAAIAFGSLRDVVQWGPEGVTIIPSKELPRDVAAAVQSVEMTQIEIPTKDGGPIVKRKIKVKQHDKLSALDGITRMLGLGKSEGAGGAAAGVQIILGGGPMGLERVDVRAVAGTNVQQPPPSGVTVDLGGEEEHAPLPPGQRGKRRT